MSHRRIIRSTAVSGIALATALATAMGAAPAAAQSFQGSPTVTFGSATVTSGSGTTQVNVASPNAVIDWTPFDNAQAPFAYIDFQPTGTTATFNGVNGNFTLLNRIVPADTSRPIRFDGNVVSRYQTQAGQVTGGTVFFYSPGGIVIGANAVFDVGNLGLTTSAPAVDGNGNWYTGNTVQFTGSQSDAAIWIDPGAQIKALSANSYVAAFAPQVFHDGTINVNGQAALVAGEAGSITFSPDGLFNIQVTTGTDAGVGIETHGTVTGPASGGGNNRVYLVAIPKNTATLMAIGRGSNIGFDVAGAANTVGNTVVLSAGHNVTGGAINASRAGGALASISIDDGSSFGTAPGIAFTSNVVGQASDRVDLSVFRQTSFASNVALRGYNGVLAYVGNIPNDSTGNLSVTGSMTLSAAPRVGAADTFGADASTADFVVLDGATANVTGNLTLDARGLADFDGDGVIRGGTAGAYLNTGGHLGVGGNLVIDTYAESANAATPTGASGGSSAIGMLGASTLTVSGVTRVKSDAYAGFTNPTPVGNGALGLGGTSYVAIQEGSQATLSELNVTADGVGGADIGAGAGEGRGGSAFIDVNDANSKLTVTNNNLTGNSGNGEHDLISAEGFGGASNLSGGRGGVGRGGSVSMSAQAGGAIALNGTSGANYAIAARGNGGAVFAAGTGGDAYAGNVSISLNAATLTGERLLPSAVALGGGAGASGITGVVNGGNGFGGNRSITVANGSTLTGSVVGGSPSGVGGNGNGNGVGGNGTGGQANLNVNASTINVTPGQQFLVFSQTIGGGGGTYGNASGGGASASVTNGSTINLGSGSTLSVNANAFANDTGLGPVGNGGNAAGGNAYLQIANSTVTGPGTLSMSALGQATANARIGGSATGGHAQMDVVNGTISVSTLNVTADGFAGNYSDPTTPVSGITGGNATGGQATLYSSGGSITANSLLVEAGAQGRSVGAAASTGIQAGSATGGVARVDLNGGTTTINAATLTLNAEAIGGSVTAGAGNGGAASALEAVFLAQQAAAGTITGALDLGANAVAGSGLGAGSTGGNATGGFSHILGLTGGAATVNGPVTLHSVTTAGNGVAAGGNAVAGRNEIFVNAGSTFAINGNLSMQSATTGGNGGTGGSANEDFDSDEAGIYIRTGSLSVSGTTTLSVSASGGNGAAGGRGGDAISGQINIDAVGTATAGGTITLGTVNAANNATGGAGGAGSGSAGGNGGFATSGPVLLFGSAGNGDLVVRGTATMSTTANGGAGGAGTAGGAGGNALGGHNQFGTRSGPDTGTVNAGSAAFANVNATSHANGGAGGAGSSGAGGNGGSALATGTVMLSRGSPVTAGAVTLDSAGTGGNGGSGTTAGAGGSGEGNGNSLAVSQRFQRTERGSVNVSSLTMTSTGTGGSGATPGASYYAGNGGLNVQQGDASVGNFNYDAGSGAAPNYNFTYIYTDSVTGQIATITEPLTALPTELTVKQGTVTASSFAMRTPGDVVIDLDQATLTSGSFTLQAGSVVLPTAAPATAGTIAVNGPTAIQIAAGGAFRTYANFDVTGDFLLSLDGPIQIGTVSADGSLLLESRTAGVAAGLLDAGNQLAVRGTSIATGAVSGANGVELTATGTLAVAGNVTSTNGPVTATGTSTTLGNVSAGGAVSLAGTAGALTAGTVGGTNITANATGGNLTLGAVTGSGAINLASTNALVAGAIGGTTVALQGASVTTQGISGTGNLSVQSAGAVQTGALSTSGGGVSVTGATATTGNVTANGTIALRSTAGALTAGNVSGSGVTVQASGGNLTLGTVSGTQGVGLSSSGAILAGATTASSGSVSAQGTSLNLGNVSAANGIALTSTAGGIQVGSLGASTISASATGGNIAAGAITASTSVSMAATGSITTGTISSPTTSLNAAGGNLTIGDLTDSNDIALVSGGTTQTGNLTSTSGAVTVGGRTVAVGNVAARNTVTLSATGGALTAGNLSSSTGAVNAAGVGISAGTVGAATSVTLQGNGGAVSTSTISAANGAVSVGGAAVTTGGVSASGPLALAASAGSLQTGALSGSSVSATAAGGNTAVGAISASGAVNVGSTTGNVQATTIGGGTVSLSAGGALTAGTVTAAQSLTATAGGLLTIGGAWSAPNAQLSSGDIAFGTAQNAGVTAATLRVGSTNGADMFVGDGLPATSGYLMSAAEFARFRSANLQIVATALSGSAPSMTIGTLAIDPAALGANGRVTFSTGGTIPAGTLRVNGAITGTGFSLAQTVALRAGTIEIDAANGGIGLTGSGSALGGKIELAATYIHVASAAILDKLRADPFYADRAADLNAPLATSRTDAVLSAQGILFNPGRTLYIQNTATAANPAGFYTIAANSDFVPQPSVNQSSSSTATPVDMIVSGRFQGTAGDVTGKDAMEAVDALIEDNAGFTGSSQVNGCTLGSTNCGVITSSSPPPVSAAAVAFLSTPPITAMNGAPPPVDTSDTATASNDATTASDASDDGAADEGASEETTEEKTEKSEEKEAEQDASTPIAPPPIIINTAPLNTAVDVTDPVSGTGNPALITTGAVEPAKGVKP